jgi:hypothetical protein
MTEVGSEAPRLERPTKTMLVAWALGECGGDREFVDKMDVAVFAFKAYPAYFGFSKYPEYPDVDAVRVQLDDMLKTKYSRPFGLESDTPLTVKGRDAKVAQWRLTAEGVRWWTTNRDSLARWIDRNARSEFPTTKSTSGRVRAETEHKAALQERIRKTAGFRAWTRNPGVSRREVGIQTFFSAFGVGPRTPLPEYREARDRMLSASDSDPQVLEFLSYLDSKFGVEYKRILSGEVEI